MITHRKLIFNENNKYYHIDKSLQSSDKLFALKKISEKKISEKKISEKKISEKKISEKKISGRRIFYSYESF